MASNETHAEIVREMRGPYYKMGRSNASLDKQMMDYMSFIADRIESAHEREVKGLIANLDALEKAVDRVCSRDEVAEIIAVKKEIQDDNQ